MNSSCCPVPTALKAVNGTLSLLILSEVALSSFIFPLNLTDSESSLLIFPLYPAEGTLYPAESVQIV